MKSSLFLEGLKSAREIVQNKGIQYLDQLIDELDTENSKETAIKQIKAEIR